MKRIAVIRGGPSEESGVSMQTGKAVLDALLTLDLPHKDIVLTKDGSWLDAGFIKQPEQALQAVDVVFNALHGRYGEDGTVQRLLDRYRVPYTGSGALASALSFQKHLTKEVLMDHDIKTPAYRVLQKDEYLAMRNSSSLENFFVDVGDELIVKPLASGSSLGTEYIPHEAALRVALERLFGLHESVLVEEYIRGHEATVGVIQHFRSAEHYALPPIEIVPPGGKPLFSSTDKYSGLTHKVVPGRFSYSEKGALADTALKIHQTLNLRQYSRSDFIVRDGEVYFLEVNTLPGLTPASLYPMATDAVGLSFPELIHHLVETA